MDMTLAGFIALGALIVGQFAWLRQDIRESRKELRGEIGSVRKELLGEIGSVRKELLGEISSVRGELGELRNELGELRERVARIEGLLEAVFMRRDLTPFPEPPPTGDLPDKSRAA